MIAVGLANHPLLVQIGITLAHFVWQGAALALVLAGLLWLLRRRPAGERYVACGGALLLMALCPVVTMVYVRDAPLPIVARDRPTDATPLVTPRLARESATGLASEPGRITPVESHAARAAERERGPAALDADAAGVAVTGTSASERELYNGVAAVKPQAAFRLAPDSLAMGLSLGALAWSFGVMVLALRLMVGWASLRRLRRKAEPLAAQVDQVVRRLRERLGLPETVPVMASRTASSCPFR